MKGNGSALLNASQQAPGGGDGARPRPSWLGSTLAFILIFTIVVDILGNLLVILSVYRNKKLRNAGRAAPCTRPVCPDRVPSLSPGLLPGVSEWVASRP